MARPAAWTPAEEARWLRQARAKRALPDYDRPDAPLTDGTACLERGCQVRVADKGQRCALHRQERALEKRRARHRKRYHRQVGR